MRHMYNRALSLGNYTQHITGPQPQTSLPFSFVSSRLYLFGVY
jgi:hypothetical protein